MLVTTALLLGAAAGAGHWLRRRMSTPRQAEASSVETESAEAQLESPDRPEMQDASPATEIASAHVDEAPSAAQTSAEATEEDADLRMHLGASAAAVALSVGGHLVFPPLALLSLPLTIVATVPEAQSMWKDARARGVRAVSVIEFGSLFGTLALGQVGFAASTAFLLHGSRWFMRRTEDRSRKQLFDVYGLLPERVRVERDGVQFEVPLEAVRIGDTVVVAAGETIPVDGEVLGGTARVDERMLTGESRPIERLTGDSVHATTLVLNGKLWVRVDKAGTDCVAGQIAQMLQHSSDYRFEIQSRAQQIVEQGAAPTLAASAFALALLGPTAALAVTYGAIGYTMRYAGPLAIYGVLGSAAREGILIKDGRALESLAEVDTVLFDKTGTLTEDSFDVERIWAVAPFTQTEVLQLSASAEQNQRHPIARAIRAAAAKAEIAIIVPDEVAVEVGAGLRVNIRGTVVYVGSERWLTAEGFVVPNEMANAMRPSVVHGATHVYVARGDRLIGAVQLVARVRPEAAKVVEALRARGLALGIVSGDQREPTQQLARTLGITEVYSNVLPAQKSEIIKRLQDEGRKVCFVGDGINDALALRAANVGISLAGANSVAKDNAPIVLLDGTLTALPLAFAWAKELDDNLRASTLMSVIPGAAIVGGVFVGGLSLPAAMVGYNISLAAAIANGLRPMWKRFAGESAADDAA